MNVLAVTAASLVGMIAAMRPRIDKAIVNSEVWQYQFGNAPAYVAHNTIVDLVDPDNDFIKLSFHAPSEDDHTLVIKAALCFETETMDDFTLKVDERLGTADLTYACDCGEHGVFMDMMDTNSIMQAMGMFPMFESIEAGLVQKMEEEQQRLINRAARRSQFTVISGMKDAPCTPASLTSVSPSI